MFMMYKLTRGGEFHTSRASPIAQIDSSDVTSEWRAAIAVEVPLMVLAFVTVGLRIYSRLSIKRKLATDDVLIILATGAALARTVISCMSAMEDLKFDKNGPDEATEVPFYKHIFERRIAYILALTFARLSVLAYYLRIFPSGMVSLRVGCYILIACVLGLFLEIFTVLMVQCQHIGMLWSDNWLDFTGSKCFISSLYSYSAVVGDSLMNCLIVALPLPYVWRLSTLRIRQRLGLVLVFGIGFIVCVVALIQIPFIRQRQGPSTYFGTTINILVSVEISFAIIAASLPDLRALMARKLAHFSPLHHRSLVTAAARVERGRAQNLGGEQDPPRIDSISNPSAASSNQRGIRKPDWLRDTIPPSLMSSRAPTQNEIPQMIRRGTLEQVTTLPPMPEKPAG